MGNKNEQPPPQPTGPCFFGQQHEFHAISARDPFSGELFIEMRCVNCGAGQ
jgi:hypothetical protein